jgi:hypothetical protein
VQPADGVEHGVGQLEGAGPGDAVPEDDGEQLVVAEPAGADALELFTRPIVRRDDLHRSSSCCYTLPAVRPRSPLTTPIALVRTRTRLLRLPIACLLFLMAGCSEPPHKEIDQAQAAVDLARTAGAEQLAPEEYAAAAAGVQKARAAVDQHDYRLALSFAIDARQRAQDAVRQAAESRKRAQREIEALYDEVATRTNRLQTLLRDAEAARTKPAELRDARATLAQARKTLQEASTAITLGKFDQGSKSLTGVRGKLDTAIADLEKIPQRQAARGKAKASAPRKEPPPNP